MKHVAGKTTSQKTTGDKTAKPVRHVVLPPPNAGMTIIKGL